MSKKRSKQHQPGERLSVYLNKDLPPHFFDWVSKQDDVSAFVLYAMDRLYAETGNVNISDNLPRRFHFLEDTKLSQLEIPIAIPNRNEPIASDVIVNNTSGMVENIRFENNITSAVQNENNYEQKAVVVADLPPVEEEEEQDDVSKQSLQVVKPEQKPEQKPVQEQEQERPKTSGQWGNLDNVNADDF